MCEFVLVEINVNIWKCAKFEILFNMLYAYIHLLLNFSNNFYQMKEISFWFYTKFRVHTNLIFEIN